MNICNGIPFRAIELKPYISKDTVYYDNLTMLDIEVSTGFHYKDSLIPFDKTKPSSFYSELDSFSLLYLWNICIDGYLFSGRCLDDLLDFLEGINDRLDGTFYIYIHNASYEFQFLRNILTNVDVFARKKRKPIKFKWKNIEFRCSYMLTRLSLDSWANEKSLPIKKLTGMYDYEKLRTPLTKLTILERDYGYNDVLVGVCGLEEYLSRYKHVKDIPLTQTSCIRKEVNKVMKNDYKIKRKVAAMTDISFEDYLFLIDCFVGGYTHANVLYSNRVIEKVWDFDISSSYPWVMISEEYPITPFVKTDNYIRYMNHPDRYCFSFQIEIFNLESRYFNTYISISKCQEAEGVLLDNGRIISAKRIVISILDVDWNIITKAYYFEKYVIKKFYYALKGFLPDSFRRYLVQLFVHKTTLKGNPDAFTLYFKSKEEINGTYGMGVTKDISDEITFINDEWGKELLTEKRYYVKKDKKIEKLYKLNIAYSQGIYVPAYGRKNLWHFVHLFDDEIMYMDTDSLKTVEDDDILKEIDSYNCCVNTTQRQLAQDLKISYDDFNPIDFKGKRHSIGQYERDKDIVKFKTLGAKRYVCQYDESLGLDYLKMTVSGVRKKAVYQLNTIDDFTEDITFTVENADKLMLVYNDEQQPIVWNKDKYDEWKCDDKFGISSYHISYSMSMNFNYLKLISDVNSDKTQIFRRKINEKK